MQFPTAIVSYADALLESELLPEARSALRAHLEETGAWLDTACDFPLSESDGKSIAAARHLLEEVQRAAEARILQPAERSRRLVELSAALAGTLERLRQARSRTYLVAIPDLDRLLVAGIAVLQGRATPAALKPRLHPAAEELEEIGRELARMAPLPELDVEALKAAHQSACTGLESLTGNLKSGLKELMEAARRLEPFYGAYRKRDTTAFGVAELDALVSPLLRAAAVAPPETWRQECASFSTADAEGLWQAWFEREPLGEAARCHGPALARECFEELGAAVEARERSGVTQAIRGLESVQRRLRRALLPLEKAIGTVLEAPVQALAAAYRGEVPRLVLLEVAQAFADPAAPPGTGRVRARVMAYLASGDRSLLLDGLETLLEAVDEMARPGYALRGLVCRCCGQPYTLHAEHDWCGQPGRSHRFLDVCA